MSDKTKEYIQNMIRSIANDDHEGANKAFGEVATIKSVEILAAKEEPEVPEQQEEPEKQEPAE